MQAHHFLDNQISNWHVFWCRVPNDYRTSKLVFFSSFQLQNNHVVYRGMHFLHDHNSSRNRKILLYQKLGLIKYPCLLASDATNNLEKFNFKKCIPWLVETGTSVQIRSESKQIGKIHFILTRLKVSSPIGRSLAPWWFGPDFEIFRFSHFPHFFWFSAYFRFPIFNHYNQFFSCPKWRVRNLVQIK